MPSLSRLTRHSVPSWAGTLSRNIVCSALKVRVPDGPGLRVIPFDRIPWDGLRDDAIRSMLRRYVRERTEDTFGVYIGDAERGTVQALAKQA